MLLIITLNTFDTNGVNHSFVSQISGDINPDQITAELAQSEKDRFLKFLTPDGFVLVRSSEISWVKVIPSSPSE